MGVDASGGSVYGGGGGSGGLTTVINYYYVGGKGGGYVQGNTTYITGAGAAGAAGLVSITYTPVTAPTIISLSPNIGYSGNTIIITGTQFINVQNVNFGVIPASSYTVTNSTSISATVPNNVAGGSVNVNVQNLVATSSLVSQDVFTYQTSSYSAGFMNFAF